MKENKSLDEMFEKLMSDQNFDRSGRYVEIEDDFITSKEIVKNKEFVENHPDIISTPNGPEEIEEELHFKRYNKQRVHKYTESELAKIRAECETTIVHDYSENDEFHMSDEERAKIDMLNEIRSKLGTLRFSYSKVDQYILAMRTVVEAWDLLEKKGNYLHSRSEFFNMVHDGRIVHGGITMPKLKKMDKYNIDVIMEYIANPELDPSNIAPMKQQSYDSFYDDEWDEETEEEKTKRLLDPEEAQFIVDINESEDAIPEIELHSIKRSLLKGLSARNIIFGGGKKKKKKLSKKKKYYRDNLHNLLNKIQTNPELRTDNGYTSSYMITQSMFSPEKKEKSFWDDLFYDGSWTNKDQLFIYNMAIQEELAAQDCPGNRFVNMGERDLQNFFRIMESNGMNVIELRRRMSMTEEGMQATRDKITKKENKKIEQALIQRVVKLNNSDKFRKLIVKAEKEINEEIKNYS